MTKDGEVKTKENKREPVACWVYIGFFIGLMCIGISVSLSGLPDIFSLTMTQISSTIFYSLLGVIFLMCWVSIPPETEESKLRKRKEAKERREAAIARLRAADKARAEALEKRRAKPIARAVVRKGYSSTVGVKKPIPGVTRAISDVRKDPPRKTTEGVEVRRGGEFIGNRMRFKVKVLNDSPYIITDVTVYLLSYPQDALKFAGEDHDSFFNKIEPGGFRSPTF
ncbi:MAG: hypothetical protein ACXABE_17525, partial [Candidatus Thorarchaeota archaeon]